jgi:hypothetical protein
MYFVMVSLLGAAGIVDMVLTIHSQKQDGNKCGMPLVIVPTGTI